VIAEKVKYKETGNEWVPQIPKHWEILKAKNVGYFEGSTVDKKINKYDKMVRIVNFMDIYGNETLEITDAIDFMKVSATEHQIKNLKVNIGDVVFTPSSEIREDIGQSAVVKFEANDLLFSYHVSRLKFTREIQIDFKKYLFNNKPALKYFSKNCKGSTRKILNRIDFKNLPIYLPPFEEQKELADYLDTQSIKINHFIQTKQRFIELLKEQRQSIIDEILNPGQTGWIYLRLKNIVTVNDETIGEETDDNFILKYIDIGNVNSLGQIQSLQEMTFKTAPSRARRIVRNGDVIISTVRTYLKAITLITSEETNLIASTGFAVLRPKSNVTSAFLNDVVHSSYFINSVTSNSYGVSYPAITANALSRLEVAIPPTTKEQNKIVKHIQTETKTLDIAISKAEREIELIKEYREAMIAEAVTGKMKIN